MTKEVYSSLIMLPDLKIPGSQSPANIPTSGVLLFQRGDPEATREDAKGLCWWLVPGLCPASDLDGDSEPHFTAGHNHTSSLQYCKTVKASVHQPTGSQHRSAHNACN